MIDLAPPLMLAAAALLSDASLDKDYDVSALTCLALNVYYEARAEPVEGQLAVAFVTLNRVEGTRFPDDICGVVGEKRGGRCQFSWVCVLDEFEPRNDEAFLKALAVSADALAGRVEDPTNGAKFFISSRIKRPDWTRRMTVTAAIEGHMFLRE